MFRNLVTSRSTVYLSGARRLLAPSSIVYSTPRQLLAPFSTADDGDGGSGEPCKLGTCMDKLGDILTDYRKANYAQTLPSRFAKEIVAAADVNHDGVITADEIRKLLRNIGAEERMTPDELDIVLVEAGVNLDDDDEEGGTQNSVPVERVLDIIKGRTTPSVNAS